MKNINDQPALRDLFKDDFHIGIALSYDQIRGNDPNAMALVERHFSNSSICQQIIATMRLNIMNS